MKFSRACDICFETYSLDRKPIQLFCCKKIVCIECLQSLATTTSSCPWDRRRWTSRSLLKKCEAATPDNLLEQASLI